MASLFQMDRVLYQCGCEEWWPLCNLYFCRHCSILRCISCSLNEIDSTFCPNCLENIPAGEARVKKNRCINCNQCPVCSMVLTTRAVGESCHLMCSTCRWSTRDSGTPDQPSSINWPVHESTLDKELSEVLERMRVLAAAEKAQRDQVKLNKRRSHNVGSLLTDRYGLQAIYQKRKKTFEKPLPQLPLHLSLRAPIPELDLTPILMIQSETVTALKSKYFGSAPAGRHYSCQDPEQRQFDFRENILSFQYFARNFVPEIRLSREPELCEGQAGSVLLTVANESNSKADVIIMADNDDGKIECLTPVVELCLPSSDDTADIYDMESDRRSTSDVLGTVVFRRRHRAGVRLEVKCGDASSKKVLTLLVKYRNEQCSMQMNTEPEWRLTRVQISL
ncbi:dynactin p62 family protein [Ostertagia ostertagi]